MSDREIKNWALSWQVVVNNVCVTAHECVYLRQAEGDASSWHSMVGLDCEHKLVIGRGLHSHMSAETGDSWLVLVSSWITDVLTSCSLTLLTHLTQSIYLIWPFTVGCFLFCSIFCFNPNFYISIFSPVTTRKCLWCASPELLWRD